jgi:hypothetical protein
LRHDIFTFLCVVLWRQRYYDGAIPRQSSLFLLEVNSESDNWRRKKGGIKSEGLLEDDVKEPDAFIFHQTRKEKGKATQGKWRC